MKSAFTLKTVAIAATLAAFSLPSVAEAHHHKGYSHHHSSHRVTTTYSARAYAGDTCSGGPNWCGNEAHGQFVRNDDRVGTLPMHSNRVHGHERTRIAYGSDDERIVSHPSECPWHLSCGCIASVKVFGHSVRGLWLASNWLKYPHAACAPGMIAARSGHVFVIEECYGDGTVLAYDGNSGGGLTRIHRVSLAGYSVRNPHAGNSASYADAM